MSQRNRKRGRRAHHRPATGAPQTAAAAGAAHPPRGRRPSKAGGKPRQRWFYDVRQYAVLTDDPGHVLILQLPADYDTGTANTWTLPGGKLEPADEPLAGLKREITEETGLSVSAVSPLTVARWSTRNSKKLAIFYKASVTGSKPQPKLSPEHQRAVWVKPADLPDFPFHRPDMLDVLKEHFA